MPRHSTRLPGSLADRCSAEFEKLEAEALTIPVGPQRDDMMRKSPPNQIAGELEKWLLSSGLQSSK